MIHFVKPPRLDAHSFFCRQLLGLSLLLLLLPGCGKAGPKGPQGTVHGKVTVKGSPAPAGTIVSFIGETASGGSGTVGADGAYRLVGPKGGETISVDKYNVVLVPVADNSPAGDEAMEQSMKLEQREAPKVDSLIPQKYQNVSTTPEKHEVKEGDNEINIDVTE